MNLRDALKALRSERDGRLIMAMHDDRNIEDPLIEAIDIILAQYAPIKVASKELVA